MFQQEIKCFVDQQRIANSWDLAVALQGFDEFGWIFLTLLGDAKEMLHEFIVVDDDVFFLGDFLEDEVGLDVGLGLSGCGIEQGFALAGDFLIVHAGLSGALHEGIGLILRLGLKQCFGDFKFHGLIEVSDHLIDLHVVDFLLLVGLHAIGDGGFEVIDGFLGTHQLDGEFVVELRQHLRLEFLNGDVEDDVFLANGFEWEVFGDGDGNIFGVADVEADELIGEAREEGIILHTHPEAFSTAKVASGATESLFEGLAIEGRGEIDDTEVFDRSTAAFDVGEVSKTLAQAIDLSVEVVLGNFIRRHGDSDAFIFGQGDLGSQGQDGIVAEAAVLGEAQIVRIAEVEHLEVLFFQRFLQRLIDQAGFDLLLDIVLEALFDDGERGFAGAEARDFGLLGVGGKNLAFFGIDGSGGNLNTESREAFFLAFDGDIHEEMVCVVRWGGESRREKVDLSNEKGKTG